LLFSVSSSTSTDALSTLAELILQNNWITPSKNPNLFVILSTHDPVPISCHLNWKNKYHICTCESKKRPCAHLVATLLHSKVVSTIDEAFKLKKEIFKVPYGKKKFALGSSKVPHKDYFVNPLMAANEGKITLPKYLVILVQPFFLHF